MPTQHAKQTLSTRSVYSQHGVAHEMVCMWNGCLQFFVIICISCLCSAARAPPSSSTGASLIAFLFGGQDVEDAPKWFAIIEVEYSNGRVFKCGGGLLSNRHVATAAHCVHDTQPGAYVKHVNVYSGGVKNFANRGLWRLDGRYRQMSHLDWDVHDYYNTNNNYNNDIAIGILKEPFTLNIAFPTLNRNGGGWNALGYNEETLNVYGFGREEDETSFTIMESVEVYPVPLSECVGNGPYEWATYQVGGDLCALGTCSGDICPDSCNGDSGGLMVHEDSVAGGGAPVVYGLVSRGHESCGQGTRYPGIYVDVYDHISWIDDRLALDWYSKHNSPVWSGPGSTSSAPRPTLYMTMWAALIAILFV